MVGVSAHVVSLPGLILQDAAEVMKRDQSFRAAEKRLKKDYTEKKIAALHKRHLRDPEGFEAGLKLLTEPFLNDVKAYLTAYTQLFETILETLGISEKEDYEELLSLKEIIDKIKDYAEEDRVLITKGSVKAFASEFKKAMANLEKQMATDYSVFDSNEKGRTSFFGIAAIISSRRTIERKSLRAANELRKEVDKLKELSGIIYGILEEGGKLNLLLYLIKYIKQMEVTDRLLKQIKRDVEIILQRELERMNTVMEPIKKFLKNLATERELTDKIEELLEELDYVDQKIERILNDLERWPRFSMALAKNVRIREKVLLTILENMTKTKIKRRKEKKAKDMGIRARTRINLLPIRGTRERTKREIAAEMWSSAKDRVGTRLQSVKRTIGNVDWGRQRRELLEKSSVLARKNLGTGYSQEYFPTVKKLYRKYQERKTKKRAKRDESLDDNWDYK